MTLPFSFSCFHFKLCLLLWILSLSSAWLFHIREWKGRKGSELSSANWLVEHWHAVEWVTHRLSSSPLMIVNKTVSFSLSVVCRQANVKDWTPVIVGNYRHSLFDISPDDFVIALDDILSLERSSDKRLLRSRMPCCEYLFISFLQWWYSLLLFFFHSRSLLRGSIRVFDKRLTILSAEILLPLLFFSHLLARCEPFPHQSVLRASVYACCVCVVSAMASGKVQVKIAHYSTEKLLPLFFLSLSPLFVAFHLSRLFSFLPLPFFSHTFHSSNTLIPFVLVVCHFLGSLRIFSPVVLKLLFSSLTAHTHTNSLLRSHSLTLWWSTMSRLKWVCGFFRGGRRFVSFVFIYFLFFFFFTFVFPLEGNWRLKCKGQRLCDSFT